MAEGALYILWKQNYPNSAMPASNNVKLSAIVRNEVVMDVWFSYNYSYNDQNKGYSMNNTTPQSNTAVAGDAPAMEETHSWTNKVLEEKGAANLSPTDMLKIMAENKEYCADQSDKKGFGR
jgi:hypothetical protein